MTQAPGIPPLSAVLNHEGVTDMFVLINPFEVDDATSDDEFLAGWERGASYLRMQPGFVDARLHRALSDDARFRFVNVASWASPAAFQAAVTGDGFRELVARNATPNFPALYRVVRTVAPGHDGAVETRLSEGVSA